MSTTRERIAKLLNMTTANGCSEDEAETALRMASSLAMKAGIELDSLRAADAPKPKATRKFNSDSWKLHQVLAAEAAAHLFGVDALAHDFGKNGITWIGREENIELAQETMFWIMRQVESLYKTHLPRGLTQAARAEFRRTFKEACALRVRDRAAELIRNMRSNDAAASATGSTALVVAGHIDTLRAEISEYWDNLLAPIHARAKAIEEAGVKAPKVKPRKLRTRTIRHGNGSNAGFSAGNSVQLRKEIK